MSCCVISFREFAVAVDFGLQDKSSEHEHKSELSFALSSPSAPAVCPFISPCWYAADRSALAQKYNIQVRGPRGIVM
jgi:hypothetical protein